MCELRYERGCGNQEHSPVKMVAVSAELMKQHDARVLSWSCYLIQSRYGECAVEVPRNDRMELQRYMRERRNESKMSPHQMHVVCRQGECQWGVCLRGGRKLT